MDIFYGQLDKLLINLLGTLDWNGEGWTYSWHVSSSSNINCARQTSRIEVWNQSLKLWIQATPSSFWVRVLIFINIICMLCRQKGLAHEVLQWYICRMEAWFAADADMISLKNWDEASWTFLYTVFRIKLFSLLGKTPTIKIVLHGS